MADVFDPGTRTKPELNRRVFVGIGAGAAAAGGSIPAALAQAEGFGKPHPPIVSENDPAIVVSRPELSSGIPAYAAVPKNATKSTPGVVVIQAIWGIDPQLTDVVRRFAKEGFVAIAPALFARQNPPSGEGVTDYTVFLPFALKLDARQVNGDAGAAADWIRKRAGVDPNVRPPKVGITGFCMGGSIGLRQMWQNPAPFDAAAIWYGNPRQDPPGEPLADANLRYVSQIKSPIEGNFGGRDTGPPPADVKLFESKLKVPSDIKIYDAAGHGFFDDTRSSYVASAASDAWTRTLAFFRKHLAA